MNAPTPPTAGRATEQTAHLVREAGTIRVSGALTFGTVPDISDKLETLLREVQCIDLSDMERVDSAGVAFLLDAVMTARRNGRPMTVSGIPPRMRSLIDVYGIAELMS